MANTTTQFTIKINGTDQVVQLNDLLGQTSDSLGELKTQQQALTQAFEQADYGSVEFLKLRDALKDVNSEIKTVDESVEGLTITEKIAGATQAVGAIGSAFAFASVSVQAFGDENSKTAEELAKLEVKIQAIQQGFTTFSELSSTLTEKNGLFKRSLDFIGKGFTTAGISARGFGLVTRVALSSIGIGLLISAVSFLIQNFDIIKTKGAELFKSFQPFFDGVRNFASQLTFGLVDNANISRIKTQNDAISSSIIKTQETTSKEIDAINKKFELGQITSIEKSRQVISQTLNNVRTANKAIAASFEGIKFPNDTLLELNKIAKDPNAFTSTKSVQQAIALKTNLEALNKRVETLQKNFRGANEATIVSPKSLNNINNLGGQFDRVISQFETYNKQVQIGSVQDILGNAPNQFSLLRKNIENAIDISNQFQKQNIDFANLIIEKKKEELKITQEIAELQQQVDLEQNKRSEANNNLLKEGVDLILSFGNALKSPEFRGDLPVFKNFKEQLQFISKNLTGTFKGIFDDILNSSPDAIVDVNTLTDALEKFRKEKIRTEEVKANEAIKTLQSQIQLNKELIELETDDNVEKSLTVKNNLLLEQVKSIEAEVKSTIANIELATTQLISSIPRTIEAAKFEEQGRQLEKAKQAFEDFKNGLQLTTQQSSLLFNQFGIDSSKAFNTLDEATQNAIQNKFTNNLIQQLNILKEVAKELAVTFPEVKDAVNTYTDAIDESVRSQAESNKLSNERIKSLQDELKLLQEQTEITKLQTAAQRPAQNKKQFEDQLDSIIELGRRQENIIEDNFAKETKGLAQTDDKYKIAILKRDALLKETNQNTIKQLDDAREAFLKLIIDSVSSIQSSIGQVSDALFQAQTDAVDRQISANQILIDDLSEQITGIQEQIGFVDEILNQRKANIDELQAAAESSTAGQREEILKQLDAEVKRTKDLVKEKKALQKQEENATKQQQKLEKENQKLALESIVIQQRQAVAAQILGLAQTAVAIATIAASSARQDFTFGIATVASIVAVTAALATNIIGINNSLKNLRAAEAAAGGAKGGFPDGFEPMAKGGYTPMKGMGRDKTGEDNVGNYRLHANEYVVPRWMVESAKYGSMVHDMERARKRGFAEGGSPVPLRQVNVDANQEINLLLRANLNRPVFVAVTDINDGQSRVNVIENRGRF